MSCVNWAIRRGIIFSLVGVLWVASSSHRADAQERVEKRAIYAYRLGTCETIIDHVRRELLIWWINRCDDPETVRNVLGKEDYSRVVGCVHCVYSDLRIVVRIDYSMIRIRQDFEPIPYERIHGGIGPG